MEIILEGEISVQKIDENGNTLKISTFSVGEILGANLLFSSRNFYPMTTIAKTNTTVLLLNKSIVLGLGQLSSTFMTNLLCAISDRTLILTDKIDAISLKTIRQRISDFLKYEYYYQHSDIIKLRFSKKELAERIGVQRSSLSRELAKMRDDGLVDFDSKTIKIKSRNLLR